MRLRRCCRAILAVSLLSTIVIAINGCLDAEEAILGRYDAARDEFVFLNVYQRIVGTSPQDSAYLATLWKNRDHILTPPIPSILGDRMALLRLSREKFARINLGQPPAEIKPLESPIALDAVRVLPGAFFLRGTDALCYYDQVVVPGAVADQLLELGRKEATTPLTDEIKGELKRRQEGGQRLAWEALRRQLAAQIRSAAKAAPADEKKKDDEKEEADPDDLIQAVDAQTLQLLLKALEQGTLRIVREKHLFRLTLPGTRQDVKEALATWRAAEQLISTETKVAKPTTDILAADKVMAAFEVRSPREDALEITLDATKFFVAIAQIQLTTDPLPAPPPDKADLGPKTLAAIRQAGVPINEKITIEQILRDFAAGTLASFPSEKPLPPGEGLVPLTRPAAP